MKHVVNKCNINSADAQKTFKKIKRLISIIKKKKKSKHHSLSFEECHTDIRTKHWSTSVQKKSLCRAYKNITHETPSDTKRFRCLHYSQPKPYIQDTIHAKNVFLQ